MRKAKRPLLCARWACLHAQALLVARSIAALAQLVEHRIRNAGVRCSSHLSGTISPDHPILPGPVAAFDYLVVRGGLLRSIQNRRLH